MRLKNDVHNAFLQIALMISFKFHRAPSALGQYSKLNLSWLNLALEN